MLSWQSLGPGFMASKKKSSRGAYNSDTGLYADERAGYEKVMAPLLNGQFSDIEGFKLERSKKNPIPVRSCRIKSRNDVLASYLDHAGPEIIEQRQEAVANMQTRVEILRSMGLCANDLLVAANAPHVGV